MKRDMLFSNRKNFFDLGGIAVVVVVLPTKKCVLYFSVILFMERHAVDEYLRLQD